ncbi:MAG TPA: carboxypeptidase-like regulatory domain-containing protein, partial [Pyrinomonadaceae bacterium]|nr:carboxypeptidase-like regulatory domain-containing protein [Pyrinomonadaceae bacterium]
MLSLTRQIFAVAILLGIVNIPLTVRPQTQADKRERTGSVSGRVTINGKAAPGIVVSLGSNEFRSRSSTSLRDVTDQDGNYRITGVPAGKYQVMHLAPALILKADDSSFNLWGKLLLIAEGETVEGFDFALMRGGVITGRVTDANGQPLIEEPITVESEESTNRLGSGNRFSGIDQQTDDRGIFRIFGLPPGRYRVGAGLSEDRSSHRIATGQIIYKKTFHPNVTDPAKATIIELSEGAEVTHVDITVGQAIQSFSASGRIVNSETGRPIGNASLYLTQMVVIHQGHTGRNVSSIPRSNSQGEFRVENLIPGTYAVSPAPDSDLRSSSIKFEIVDQDVSGLILKTSPGASVAGTVVIENPEKGTDKSNLAQLYISAQISGEDNEYGLARLWSIKPDGGFRFGGLPAGAVQFSIGAFSRADSGF